MFTCQFAEIKFVFLMINESLDVAAVFEKKDQCHDKTDPEKFSVHEPAYNRERDRYSKRPK